MTEATTTLTRAGLSIDFLVAKGFSDGRVSEGSGSEFVAIKACKYLSN